MAATDLTARACLHCLPRPAAQALGAMLAADAFSRQLSDLEQLAVILAAVVHDVGHPGVNNDFLIRTQSEVCAWVVQGACTGHQQLGEATSYRSLCHRLITRRLFRTAPGAQAAVAYNDQSINENMHAAAGFKLLAKKENNFLCGCAGAALGSAAPGWRGGAASTRLQCVGRGASRLASRGCGWCAGHDGRLHPVWEWCMAGHRASATRCALHSPPPQPPARSLPADDFRAVRRLVIRIILATDMARHHECVTTRAAAAAWVGV